MLDYWSHILKVHYKLNLIQHFYCFLVFLKSVNFTSLQVIGEFSSSFIFAWFTSGRAVVFRFKLLSLTLSSFLKCLSHSSNVIGLFCVIFDLFILFIAFQGSFVSFGSKSCSWLYKR